MDKLGVYDVFKEMNLMLEKMDVGIDLVKVIDIKLIYFDLGKFDICLDVVIELDKIVKVMNEYLMMVVELGVYMDCRGLVVKNLELFEKRVIVFVDYIKVRINNLVRIYGKGYGESKILNGCICEGKKNLKYIEV